MTGTVKKIWRKLENVLVLIVKILKKKLVEYSEKVAEILKIYEKICKKICGNFTKNLLKFCTRFSENFRNV